MKQYHFEQYNRLIERHLMYKLLKTEVGITTVIFNLDLLKISSIKNLKIFDAFFLLEFLSNRYSFINFLHKKYNLYDFAFKSVVKRNDLNYFLGFFTLFIVPYLNRQGNFFPIKFDNGFSYVFPFKNVKDILFISDRYFKWQNPVNIYFKIKNSDNRQESKLLLSYFGFF